MSEQNFINSILAVASELKDAPLTETEKNTIIRNFNAASGDSYARAKRAIEGVLGRKLPDERIIEKASSSINNIRALLRQMSTAAQEWQKKK
ncbi:hypothetical protein LEP1GSC050_0524 [Leptospira broomii serovar Hurstbridge str. 5399]|uniref:Uncharacterized protein n=1 Tax=Leptospira broomii serovar Hurstbridge str. 5399 TaxID=1049789 RepID=T0GI90_9LEPT|nr:hypothetical protein [Leptospira broomii]EQA46544.1 hypothetical protein LEP1GSC050_0524 [Leptospira broomii serovar Hurstbridge str. 5399]